MSWVTMCAVLTVPNLPPSSIFPVHVPPDFSFLSAYLTTPPPSSYSAALAANPSIFSLVDAHFLPEILAYLDSIIATQTAMRSDVHEYIHTTTGELRIVGDGVDCVTESSSVDFTNAGWLSLPFSVFDVTNPVDWEYYFKDRFLHNLESCQAGPLVPTLSRYFAPSGTVSCHGTVTWTNAASTPTAPTSKPFKGTQVINLDRRMDRWHGFNRVAAEYADTLSPITRVSAVDGRTLNLVSSSILSLFSLKTWSQATIGNPHSHHGYAMAVVGNALSHVDVLRGVCGDGSEANRDEYVLVLEDDIDSFSPDFAADMASTVARIERDQTWDVILLGTFSESVDLYNDRRAYDEPGVEFLKRVNHEAKSRTFGGGSHAYLVRRKGACKLLKLAEETHVMQAIDWFILHAITTQAIVGYKCNPNLVNSKSVLEESGRVSSSDVGGEGQVEYHNHRVVEFVEEEGMEVAVVWPTRGTVVVLNADATRDSPEIYLEVGIVTGGLAANIFGKRHSRSRMCVAVGALTKCQLIGVDEKIGLSDILREGGTGTKVLTVQMVTMFDKVIAEEEVSVDVKIIAPP